MHRSGTSLVTKCFECFGYGLGETLMAPSSDNPKGFFEDLDIVNLNDNLLRDNGSYWDAPVFVGQGPLSWDATHLDAGVKLLTAKLALLPAHGSYAELEHNWQKLLGHSPKVSW